MSKLLVACGDSARAELFYGQALEISWGGGLHFSTPRDPSPDPRDFVGLVIAGGLDIHPCRWEPREELDPRAEPDPGRDERELALIARAWELGRPILGICRGHQILNVARGGSMVQHVPAFFGCDVSAHQQGRAEDGPGLVHRVYLAPESRLANLLGTPEFEVNSRHHQAVRRIGQGLRAVGWHPATESPEGSLVEALEAEDPGRWVIGVQWHPENLVGLDGPAGEAARQLFRAFGRALA